MSLVTLALFAVLIALPTAFLLLRPPPRSPNAPPLASSALPLLGSLDYFSRRWSFFKENSLASKTGNFSFSLAQHRVIGLSGTEGRQHFFGSSHYSFDAGYAVLFGLAPDLNDIKNAQLPSGEGHSASHFTKRIVTLMKRERLVSTLGHLLDDTKAQLDKLGSEGITNPFDSIYLLVFQLTMRVVGCREISEDPVLLEQVLHLFEDVESSSTPTAILFPWFPSPAKIKRTVSATKLYLILQKILDDRKRENRTEDDPLQALIDAGDSPREILEFVIGALFAGQLNSGINACYILCYLSLSPEWVSRCRAEITQVAATHATNPAASLEDQIKDIPIEAWESDFPILDLCLKDSIRLHLQGAALRRNISGRPDKLGDEVIDDGSILAYHLADIHMDPNVYAEPEKWDPSRYLPDRAEDKKVPFGWVGWGISRHPCLGMRFAKLESNMILAYFVAKFDFQLTDAGGKALASLPPLDENAHSAVKPTTPVFLKYTQRT